MTDKLDKAAALLESRRIRRVNGLFYVPSATTEGREYTVQANGQCSCPSLKTPCCHQLCTVYIDAFLSIWIMRRADSMEWIEAVIDRYSERVEVLPMKIRQWVREEYFIAVSRIREAEAVAA